MSYVRQESMVIYKSKMGKISDSLMQQILLQVSPAIFPIRANKWLGISAITAMSAGVEGKDKRKMNFNYCIIADNQYIKGCNKSWARLIKKIYEVDPLICPKCGEPTYPAQRAYLEQAHIL